MTGRELHKEWIGAHALVAIPPKIKLRVLDAQRPAPNELPICPDCGLPIRVDVTPEFDHRMPLADGGEHRESNLKAVHPKCHKLKTAREAHARAESRAVQKSVWGIKPSRSRFPSRGFHKSPPQKTATRPIQRKGEVS